MKSISTICTIILVSGTICLAESHDASGWIKYTNNPVLGGNYGTCFDISVLKKNGGYQMWFSWRPKSSIALVDSKDGFHWSKPRIVLGPNKASGWEDDINRPVVIKQGEWEQDKVTACQVVNDGRWYLMFYIGFSDVNHAQIGVARSKDGISDWERLPSNPIIKPTSGGWDADACYKPYAILDGKKWLLWYNGRHGSIEQIGVAIHEGSHLGFNRLTNAESSKKWSEQIYSN